ncbi:MAG: hypothetical protein ACQESP_13010 [Candidatus Muiribacteriota bacterium]
MKKNLALIFTGILITHFFYFVLIFPDLSKMPDFIFKFLLSNWLLFLAIVALSLSLFINYFFLKPVLDKKIQEQTDQKAKNLYELYRQDVEDDRLRLLKQINAKNDELNGLKQKHSDIWTANKKRIYTNSDKRQKRKRTMEKKKRENQKNGK